MLLRNRNILATGVCLTLTLLLLMAQFMFVDLGKTQAQAAEAGLFADVTVDDPSFAYINYLANRKIVAGFPDGTYHPQAEFTRAQAAFLMTKARGLDLTEAAESGFRDVTAEHWAFNAIGAAVKAGCLRGYPDGTFRPEQPITRAEGVALALRLSESDLPATDLPRLADVPADHWAAKQIGAALDAGLITLADATHFTPDAALNRGGVARAFARMLVLAPEYRAATLAGVLRPISGTVKVKPSSAVSFQTVAQQVPLKVGDTIMTEASSVAEVAFDDGTALRIEPNTQIVITKTQGLKYIKKHGDAGTAVDLLGIDLKQGEIFGALASHAAEQSEAETTIMQPQPQVQPSARLASAQIGVEYPTVSVRMAKEEKELPWWKKPQEKKVRVEVNMPWGVCGIRGTFFQGYVAASGASGVNLLTGSAVVTSGGQETSLQAGEKAVIEARGTIAADRMQPQDYQGWARPEIQSWANQTAANIDNNAPVPAGTPQPPALLSGEENNQEPAPPETMAQSGQVQEALKQASGSTTPPPSTSNPGGGGGGGGGGSLPTPVITKVEPLSGSPGTPVIIAGSNFGDPQGSGTVVFGDLTAQVVNWSNSSITVIIPTALQPGSVEVVVSREARSSGAWRFTVSEHLASEDPPALPAAFYGLVTINGSLAPVGTEIIAQVEGAPVGKISVGPNGWYGEEGALGAKLIIGSAGTLTEEAMIEFMIKGQKAAAIAFRPGMVQRLDLSL